MGDKDYNCDHEEGEISKFNGVNITDKAIGACMRMTMQSTQLFVTNNLLLMGNVRLYDNEILIMELESMIDMMNRLITNIKGE